MKSLFVILLCALPVEDPVNDFSYTLYRGDDHSDYQVENAVEVVGYLSQVECDAERAEHQAADLLAYFYCARPEGV